VSYRLELFLRVLILAGVAFAPLAAVALVLMYGLSPLMFTRTV